MRVVLERRAGAELEPGVGIAFVRNDGLVCYCVSTEMDGVTMERHADGTFRAALHVPNLPLLGGEPVQISEGKFWLSNLSGAQGDVLGVGVQLVNRAGIPTNNCRHCRIAQRDRGIEVPRALNHYRLR